MLLIVTICNLQLNKNVLKLINIILGDVYVAKSKKQNTLFVILIALLICVLVVFGIFLIAQKNNSSLAKKYSSEAESYKSQMEKEKTEKEKLQGENSSLLEENNSLKEKNSSLEKEIEELAKKKRESSGKVCYLTFDDGPSDNTLKNLETLKKYNAKATFFVIGSAKLDYLKNISDGGHAIGLHSGCHEYQKIYSSTDAYFNDLNDISSKVKSITGKDVKIIRFPGGSSNTVSAKYCSGIMSTLTKEVENRGYRFFDWNISSGDADSKPKTAEQIANNVISGCQGKNSVCVLMHDTAAKNSTVEALPRILEGLKNQGFSFESLDVHCEGFHQKVNN